jgi:hypothetical protein
MPSLSFAEGGFLAETPCRKTFSAAAAAAAPGWSFLQPFARYISRPDGFSGVANVAILGGLPGVDL